MIVHRQILLVLVLAAILVACGGRQRRPVAAPDEVTTRMNADDETAVGDSAESTKPATGKTDE